MRRFSWMASTACVLVLIAGTAEAKKRESLPPMPAGYDDPGPEPENPLPGIIEKLRRRLVDPASLRDMTLCPARSFPVFSVGSTWVPAGWILQLTLNAKNRFGGYTGSVEYTAHITGGVVKEVSETPPIEMIIPTVRPSYIRSAAECPRIPNVKIQSLMEG